MPAERGRMMPAALRPTLPAPQRIAAGAMTVAIHLLLLVLLVHARPGADPAAPEASLATFDVPPPAPSPSDPPPEPRPEPAGAAAPPALRADPRPEAAPVPEIRLPDPPPIALPPVTAEGADATAGAAPLPGPGTGAGGSGTGLGSGTGGSGTGGGLGTPARHIAGRITDRDYPAAARRLRAQGEVWVRFTVRPDGRVAGCSATRSSGSADLDAATCRLIERRFRYRPATGADGKGITQERGWRQNWWLEPRETPSP